MSIDKSKVTQKHQHDQHFHIKSSFSNKDLVVLNNYHPSSCQERKPDPKQLGPYCVITAPTLETVIIHLSDNLAAPINANKCHLIP